MNRKRGKHSSPVSLCIIGFLRGKACSRSKGNKNFFLHTLAELNLHAKFIGVGIFIAKSKFNRVDGGGTCEKRRKAKRRSSFVLPHAYTHAHVAKLSLHNNCTQFLIEQICITFSVYFGE